MASNLRNRMFIFHFIICMVTFMMVLSSTVSDYWSTNKYGFHGLFKECNLITACSSVEQSTALFRGIQLLQVISCISIMCGVVYCFISILLREYLQSKLYVMAFFYGCVVICVTCTSSIYYVIIHQDLKGKELKIGWAFYIYASSAVTSLLGFSLSFTLYQQERKETLNIVVLDEKEMQHHQKSFNRTKT